MGLPNNALRAALVVASLSLMDRPVRAIDFFPTPDAAVKAHPDDTRPRVLIFGSQTCGWCRKLAADTLSSTQVEQSAGQFLWIKIDVDEHEALAARYGVRGLPHTSVVDVHGNVLGEQPGYMPAQAFVDFLTKSLAQPAPTAQETDQLLAALRGDDAEVRKAAIRKLVEQVSRVEAIGRDQTIRTVKELDAARWAEIVPYLSHPRLSIRATAHGLLSRSTPADIPFDPFASSDAREAQLQAWVDWMKAQGATVAPLELPASPEESTQWPMRGDEPATPPTDTDAADVK